MNKRCDWILRSMMFVPGHNEKLINKAFASDADALILDLEDSVKPDSNKDIARTTIMSLASKCTNKKIFVRVNDRDSGLLLKDVIAVHGPFIDGILMPKVCNADDIKYLSHIMEALERERGYTAKTAIAALIETAAAVVNIKEICEASDRVVAVTFGCEDFIADLEGYHDIEHESIYVPRALIALGARATGVIPIDTVHINVHDLDDLEAMLKVGRKMGFEGQLVLHPKEIPLVHKYYTPDEKEVRDAKAMLNMYERAEKENKGVTVYDGKFVGPPMVIAAKKTIERHKKIERNRTC
jgi:citrate lyase subunit beta / citryl-CoA lyase